jgi:hypothetical protein
VNCRTVPASFHTVYADNGDPLLLYGLDREGNLFLWPTPYICQHAIAFGRWCRQHVHEFKGCKFTYNHTLNEKTQRWARWLGVRFEAGVV